MGKYQKYPTLDALQRYTKISSIFLLSIFSVLTLHQMVPHVHHEHEQLEVATQSVSDHHANDHQHAQDEGEGNDKDEKNDFWGLLFGNHAHNYHSDFNERAEKKELKRQNKEKDFDIYRTTTRSVLVTKTLTPLLGKHPPSPNYKVYLLNQALRGPPSLG